MGVISKKSESEPSVPPSFDGPALMCGGGSAPALAAAAAAAEGAAARFSPSPFF